jgi:small-conductance mechanosensitive channel
MSGRRFRRAAAGAALGLGVVLVALAALYGEDAPVWSIPLLAAAILILCELVSLSRGPAPDAAVERPAVTALLVGRLLVAALLAFAGATVAVLAAAPDRHGLATGLLGAAAAAALFLLVAAVARRGGEA